MNHVSRLYSLLASLFLFISIGLYGQGYHIEVSLKGLSGDTLILGEYLTSRMVPKDTIILDNNGNGIFRGEEPWQGGLYLIYFNPGRYFDFLLGDDQQLSIRADTADLLGSMVFEGSTDNTVFQDYKRFLELKRGEIEQQNTLLITATTKADSTAIMDRQKQINSDMEQYMNAIGEDHQDNFVSVFIGATREPIPPGDMLNGDRRHDDSLRFFYYRDHYFDRFNPFDIRLLHTPLYEGKIKNYITRAVAQHPDSLVMAVDYLLEGAKAHPEMYRYMLITLFNHFAESKYMGMDVVYFHIAEYYYIPDATWSSPDFIGKLKDNLEKNKPTLIGQTAPNLVMRRIPPEHFQMALEDTIIRNDPHIGHDFFIHEIEAPYTILYFWEADCGHCKTATPELHQVFSRLKDKGVEVLSVHVINTVEGKGLWVDFVNQHHMYDWINCWSPYSNEFRRLYNLQAYPQLFIMDKDKKIVAKRITPEQAEKIINNLIAIESKNNS